MIGKRLIAATCAALLLPLAAAAENAVEALPTTAPMTEPVVETNEYAFTDLTAYYEDAYEDENGTQKPALTPDEKNRLTEARQRWDAGERPESSILDLMENISLSLVRLPAEQYEGRSWFLFLPYRKMTDGELLQVVDAFEQLGIRFDPEMLNGFNCMRGGGNESVRGYRGDEWERIDAISSQFTRLGLQPDSPFTASVMDDGIGEVTLNENEECFSGLDRFSFWPARRMTDEELLRIYAKDAPESASAPDDLAKYESLLRRELQAKIGMPLSVVRDGPEDVNPSSNGAFHGDAYNDTRVVYRTSFRETGGSGRNWSGALDISTGKLTWSKIDLDQRVWGEDTRLHSDVRLDPWDSRWIAVAEETVRSMLGGNAPGIDHTEAWSEEQPNGVDCVCIRVTATDGAVYRVSVSYALNTAITVEYNDAVSMVLEDSYCEHMLEDDEENG